MVIFLIWSTVKQAALYLVQCLPFAAHYRLQVKCYGKMWTSEDNELPKE